MSDETELIFPNFGNCQYKFFLDVVLNATNPVISTYTKRS